MFCSFYLNTATKDKEKRIIFCKPFMPSAPSAWAVLRTKRLENQTGGILGGKQQALDACILAIDACDDQLPDDVHKIIQKVTEIANAIGCVVMFKQNTEKSFVGQHETLEELLSYLDTVTVNANAQIENITKNKNWIQHVANCVDTCVQFENDTVCVSDSISCVLTAGLEQTDFLKQCVENFGFELLAEGCLEKPIDCYAKIKIHPEKSGRITVSSCVNLTIEQVEMLQARAEKVEAASNKFLVKSNKYGTSLAFAKSEQPMNMLAEIEKLKANSYGVLSFHDKSDIKVFLCGKKVKDKFDAMDLYRRHTSGRYPEVGPWDGYHAAKEKASDLYEDDDMYTMSAVKFKKNKVVFYKF